ncbi:uncharacterized protein B0I36DRAFT_159499 [Microdochium trichocladiopsis]|uniref:Uncharacterized protein n=1 Tax=Microdochium trichocladiopsis TaxID=1682393 RepID=A0A9P9BR37_9PEZI|nr:uncharacterized protein B0I36DRAFT_159499 [Microdochium trichocladiopsis]KAH7026517.1 hypothetical protein B0I36DRAFT_159499 [Microdochium trichocladiopsis]
MGQGVRGNGTEISNRAVYVSHGGSRSALVPFLNTSHHKTSYATFAADNTGRVCVCLKSGSCRQTHAYSVTQRSSVTLRTNPRQSLDRRIALVHQVVLFDLHVPFLDMYMHPNSRSHMDTHTHTHLYSQPQPHAASRSLAHAHGTTRATCAETLHT